MRFFKTVEAKGEQDKLLVLKQFVGSDEDPKFFIHFGFIDRVGINPQSKFATPNGVYGYPLTQEIFNMLLTNKLPFANDRPYLHVISCERPLVNLKNYSQEDLARDSGFIQNSKLLSGTDMWNAMMKADNQSPGGQMWNITRVAARWDKNKWNALFRKMGHAGFYDPGLSIIHEYEPTQIVILETSTVIRVKTMINPYARVNNEDMSDRQDKNRVQQIIDKNNKNQYYDTDDMDQVKSKLMEKYKEVFGSETVSFSEVAGNIEAITNNFDEMQIRFLIKMAIDSFSDYDERTRKYLVLRIIYHDAFEPDAQVHNLVDFITYYQPGDEKYLPVQSLTNAVSSLDGAALSNAIQSAKFELGPDAELNKMFVLLKKILDKKQSKDKNDFVKLNLFNDIPEAVQKTLLAFDPKISLTTEQKIFLNKLSVNKNLIDVVANDEELFKKLAGAEVVNTYHVNTAVNRKAIIEDAILLVQLSDKYNGFKSSGFSYLLKEKPWMIDRLKNSEFLFKMCGGGEYVYGRADRLKFIKKYIDEMENS